MTPTRLSLFFFFFLLIFFSLGLRFKVLGLFGLD